MIGSEAAVAIASRTIACSACTEPTMTFRRRSREAAAASIWAGAGSGMPQRYGRGRELDVPRTRDAGVLPVERTVPVDGTS